MSVLEYSSATSPSSAPEETRPRLWRLTIQTLQRLTWAQRGKLTVALVLITVTASCEAFIPIVLGNTVSEVSEGGTKMETIFVGLALMFILTIGGRAFAVARQQIIESTATEYELNTRISSHSHAIRLDAPYYRRLPAGAISERIARGVEGSSRLLKLAFMDLLPASVLALVAVIASFQVGMTVGIASITVVAIGLLIVRLQIRSQDSVRTSIRNDKESIIGSVIEALLSIEVIRSYANEKHFDDEFSRRSRAVRQKEMKHHHAMGGFDLLKTTNEAFFTTVVVLIVVLSVDQGLLAVGTIMTSYLLFQKVLTPLGEIHRMLDEAAEAAKQTHDLFEFQSLPIDARYRNTKETP